MGKGAFLILKIENVYKEYLKLINQGEERGTFNEIIY